MDQRCYKVHILNATEYFNEGEEYTLVYFLIAISKIRFDVSVTRCLFGSYVYGVMEHALMIIILLKLPIMILTKQNVTLKSGHSENA